MKTTRTTMLVAAIAALLIVSSSHAERNVPRTNDLLFSAITTSFPSNGYQGNWTTFWPLNAVTAMASPRVETIAGMKWVQNLNADGDGYRQNYHPRSTNAAGTVILPCNGVSVFAAVIPTRNSVGAAWNSLIDVMYDRVRLGIFNNSGVINVTRQGAGVNSGYAIPDRQMTILSVVIQSNGTFKTWMNGSNIMNEASTTPLLTNLYPTATDDYRKYVNIGRNNPDGWTTFNGNIGDVFFYTNALSDAERQQLEADLYTNFFSTARTVVKPASSLATMSATLNGDLLTAGLGTAPDIYACYGTANGGITATANWQNVELVGTAVANGAFSKAIAGLTPGTLYYCIFYATNSVGETWSDAVDTFTTPNVPAISNEVPYSVRVSTARARGCLAATNFAQTTVTLYHGTNDGGTTAANWQYSENLGVKPIGRLDAILTNITGTYYYRYYATNLAGETWASDTVSFTPTETPYDAPSNGYLRVITVTFNGYGGSKPLADYPALVRLNQGVIQDFTYSQFLSGSNDIRFVAADGSLLSYEIDTWNPGGDSFIWVRVPVLETNTQIRMFYGKAADAAPTDSTNTWDDGFAGVWHLSTSMSKNATGNTAYDTNFKQGTQSNFVAMAGVGQWCLQSANSFMQVGDVDLTQTLTMSFWAYYMGQGTTGDQWNFQKAGSYGYWIQYGGWHPWVVAWNDTTTGSGSANNVWQFMAGTYDGYVLRHFTNGVQGASLAKATTVPQNNNQLQFGINFNGVLDEVRAEKVVRSADWLLATYRNMTGAYSFATYVASNLVNALSFVDITNVAGMVDLPGSTTSFDIAGTNNEFTVGDITWTNTLTGAYGTVPAAATGWVFTVTLSPGDNVIDVQGRNASDVTSDDTVTLRIPSVKVQTAPATEVGPFSAMLNGSVNPYDVTTYTWFEYGTDTNYGTATTSLGAGNGNVYVPCSNAIASLSADTLYHFRAMASNVMGVTVAGADATFRTLPLIYTLDATNIQSDSAVLNGEVNPNAIGSVAWFEWGTNTSYGNVTTPVQDVGGGASFVKFSRTVAGLTNDVVYHFRAVSSNGATAVFGQDKEFIGGRNITQKGLYFSVLAASLPDTDGAATGPWKQALPDDGTTFPTIGAPTVCITNGAKWEQNYYNNSGYRVRDLSANASIPCDGVTIVANVQPIYQVPWGDTRGEVVDIFYDRLALAVAVGSGKIMVARNYWVDFGPVLPEGIKTVLSLTVQADGSYVCYTNGAVAMTGAANGAFTNMVPTGTETFKKYVNIGRNNPDGWSAFNGLLGDIFVFTNALADAERRAVENLPPPPEGNPADVELFQLKRAEGPANYGQMSLSWSNGTITVLACTNRSYTSHSSYWFAIATNVSSPWTHTEATNFASVYYRIVSGAYTSKYDVGKYDVQIAAGSISWLSFPLEVQPGCCEILSKWFGEQIEARPFTSFNFVSLQRQDGPGGSVLVSDYYFDDGGSGVTNWFPGDSAISNNAGYVLFLPSDHAAVTLTGLGMVPTNDVTMNVPYATIPWLGLSYPANVPMVQSGLANLCDPAQPYSGFNYDYMSSQQTPGGPVQYAEYFIDDWGTGATNFYPSIPGADAIDGGKATLLFFSPVRTGTGVWDCARPY